MKKLPKWMTTVTPLSKTVALIVFTTFPVFAFFFGRLYEAVSLPYTPGYHPAFIVREVAKADTQESLINRCGGFDVKLMPATDKTMVVSGPAWAPDCRHTAWSSWKTVPIVLKAASMAAVPEKATEREGIFLYSDADKKVVRVYTPEKTGQHPTFLQWVDRNNFLFDAGGKKYRFNLPSKQIRQD